MTGKWHLAFGGHETAALPFNRGFDKTFILDATEAITLVITPIFLTI